MNFDFEVRDYCDANECTFFNQYNKMLTGASVSNDNAGNLKVIIPSPFHMANKTFVSQAYCDSNALTDDFYFHENTTAAELDGSFIASLDIDDYYCFVTEDSYYRGYKQLLALNYKEQIEAQIRSYLAYFEQEWMATITVEYMNGGFHVFFSDVTFKTFGAARRNTYTNLGSLSSVIKASTAMIVYETTSFFEAPYNNRYQWQWEAMKNEILTTGGIKFPGNLNIVVPHVRPNDPTIKSIPLYVPVAPIASEDACKDLGFFAGSADCALAQTHRMARSDHFIFDGYKASLLKGKMDQVKAAFNEEIFKFSPILAHSFDFVFANSHHTVSQFTRNPAEFELKIEFVMPQGFVNQHTMPPGAARNLIKANGLGAAGRFEDMRFWEMVYIALTRSIMKVSIADSNAKVAAAQSEVDRLTPSAAEAAEAPEESSNIGIYAGAGAAGFVLIVIIVVIVVRRRGSGGGGGSAPRTKSVKTDRTVVAFENPMYDDPGTGGAAAAIYDNGEVGGDEGLYDEPAFNSQEKSNPMYQSNEDLAGGAVAESSEEEGGYLDVEEGYLDVSPEDEAAGATLEDE